jgi:hypothetical protein
MLDYINMMLCDALCLARRPTCPHPLICGCVLVPHLRCARSLFCRVAFHHKADEHLRGKFTPVLLSGCLPPAAALPPVLLLWWEREEIGGVYCHTSRRWEQELVVALSAAVSNQGRTLLAY